MQQDAMVTLKRNTAISLTTVMNLLLLDLTRHASQPLSDDLVEAADLVVCMTPGHARSVASRWPEHEEKVVVLDPLGVPDPIGGSVQVYQACAEHIAARGALQTLELNFDEIGHSLPTPGAATNPTKVQLSYNITDRENVQPRRHQSAHVPRHAVRRDCREVRADGSAQWRVLPGWV